ncbi:tryptophan permease [Parashewanella spongiae]|uniref:Aromatic amino acid permease n=1 Tax=Parashewanella spongiae TaxID=342950 RepID=A0A3A6TX15_9GAMM|nr:aromatic amino acid transport family protein [Parashewanella spongiae]MCL1077875.1 aromatic amino acid transporter [Parashewanella spongiae]RJY17605.1 tryptophan permease [Parashewanella spongiae]
MPISEKGIQKKQSIIGGAMIVAGTAVGAGMFSLPVVGSGMWFSYSVLMLIGVWLFMVLGGLLLLEANLHYEAGVSFDSLAKNILGKFWRVVNGISIAFLMYVLTYAYVSGGGSIVDLSFQEAGLHLPAEWSGLLFSVVLASFVIVGTKQVSRISTIMLGGMILCFFFATSNLLWEIDPVNLWLPNTDSHYAPYMLAALPIGLASFGYQGVIPSLVKHYDKSASQVIKAILVGTLLALIIYISWLVVTMGNIQRNDFINIINMGGNMGAMVGALTDVVDSNLLSKLLTLFANLAVASSFLGVSLGLFDYLADLFGFDNSWGGRIKTGLITFVPPTVLGVFYPNGFILAIGFAALAGAISVAITPALMALKVRKLFPNSVTFKTPGGATVAWLVLIYGVVIMVCHILKMLGLLPVYG